MVLKLNTIKNLYQKILPRKKDCILTEKIIKQKVSQYTEGRFFAPEEADTFSKITVQKKSEPYFKKEITSFYDEKGAILKRYISSTRDKVKERVYTFDKAPRDYQNAKSAAVTIRNVVTKEIGPKGLEKKIKEESFYIYPLPMRMQCSTSKPAMKLSSNIKEYDYNNNGIDLKSVITEYPANSGIEPKSAKKVLEAQLHIPAPYSGKDAVVKSIQTTGCAEVPCDDEFLAARFLTGEEKIIYLTNYFLKQKNLEKLGIKVEINPQKAEEAIAAFSSKERAVYWKRVPEHTLTAQIAAHEAEHAHQSAQIGRYEKMMSLGSTGYEQDCAAFFGPLAKEEIPQARKYYAASEMYPDKNAANYTVLHDENYLEKMASEAELKVLENYSKGRNFLKEQFQFIPDSGDIF